MLRAPEVRCTEFRVLRAGLDLQGKIRRAEDVGLHQGGSTLAGWYDDMELLTAHTRRLHAVSGYVTINSVRPDLLARCNNRLIANRQRIANMFPPSHRSVFVISDRHRIASIGGGGDYCLRR